MLHLDEARSDALNKMDKLVDTINGRSGVKSMAVRIIRFEKSVADSILTAAISVHPRETILLLQGKKTKDEIRLHSVLIPPLATYGHGFSALLGSMLPWDVTVMGIAHSHPSGNQRPSTHDLNHFYGRIMVIAAYPYQEYTDLAAYDGNGNRIPHEIVPDRFSSD